jgi:hypothetical protein
VDDDQAAASRVKKGPEAEAGVPNATVVVVLGVNACTKHPRDDKDSIGSCSNRKVKATTQASLVVRRKCWRRCHMAIITSFDCTKVLSTVDTVDLDKLTVNTKRTNTEKIYVMLLLFGFHRVTGTQEPGRHIDVTPYDGRAIRFTTTTLSKFGRGCATLTRIKFRAGATAPKNN